MSVAEFDGVKIRFATEVQDGWPPVPYETLWAERAEANLYRIDNVPFFVYGIAYRDLVEVMPKAPEETVFWFHRVVRRSGHSTYRIMLRDSQNKTIFNVWWAKLGDIGCTYESADGRLLAIDMPPHVDARAAYTILQDGCEQDIWDFEEGYCFDGTSAG